MLLAKGADVNAVTKLRGSPLHSAAVHGTGHAVKVLLDRCARWWAGDVVAEVAAAVARLRADNVWQAVLPYRHPKIS